MKNTIEVINIKCGGCATMIRKALEKKGAQCVEIDIKAGVISYTDGPEKDESTSLLSSLGYPEIGSPEAESVLKMAQSYMSCALGKIQH